MTNEKSSFPLRLKDGLHAQVKAAAELDDRPSMNYWINVAIEKRLESEKSKTAFPTNGRDVSESMTFFGMDLEIYYDEDGCIVSATNEHNIAFYDMLSDYYVEQLNDAFFQFMKTKADEEEVERKL